MKPYPGYENNNVKVYINERDDILNTIDLIDHLKFLLIQCRDFLEEPDNISNRGQRLIELINEGIASGSKPEEK